MLNKLQTSFMSMLNFPVTLVAVKHPNQWAVIELCVKKELLKGLLELMLVIFC